MLKILSRTNDPFGIGLGIFGGLASFALSAAFYIFVADLKLTATFAVFGMLVWLGAGIWHLCER